MGSNPDMHGHQHRQRSWFIRNNKKHLVEDVWFKYTAPADIPQGKAVVNTLKEIDSMMKIAKGLGY